MGPKIYLLARPHFDGPYTQFLDDYLPAEHGLWREDSRSTEAERIVEFAGRVCYMSFGPNQSSKSNAEYISNLIRNGHESVLEHAIWTLAISGVSRAFTHQFVRHRVGFAFSQLSQQYHDESAPKFVRPAGIDAVPTVAAIWNSAIRESQSAYKKILAALEDAASASPLDSRREKLVSFALYAEGSRGPGGPWGPHPSSIGVGFVMMKGPSEYCPFFKEGIS